jgi:hypothetical protein
MPEVKPGFKDCPFFLSQHGYGVMQVDIPEKTMFFHSMDAWLCKLEIKVFPNFFPQHGIFLMQVGNE